MSGLFRGSFPHTAVRSSSSSCHSAWLALPWLPLELLRSGTRHAIAKQPEAGDLEGTGGALAPPIPGGGRETGKEKARTARGSLWPPPPDRYRAGVSLSLSKPVSECTSVWSFSGKL